MPIQSNSLFSLGTEVFVGTPSTRYLMNPDFESTETRLFSGAETRSPFLDPVAHSTSLAAAPAGSPFSLVDNMTLAGVAVPGVGLSLVREADGDDSMFAPGMDGRVGLGPRSAFAQARVIAVTPVNITTGADEGQLGKNIELLSAIPAATSGETDVALPITAGESGWRIRARVTISDLPISSALQDIVIDPISRDFEVPNAVMDQLVARLPGAFDDGMRRLWLPCDAEGLFTVPPDALFVLPGGADLYTLALFTEPEERMIKTNLRTGGRVCSTAIAVNVARPSAWRLNPLMAMGGRAVFLDSRTRRVIVRTGYGSPELPTIAPIAVPLIPVFSDYVTRTAGNITELRFNPVPAGRTGVAR